MQEMIHECINEGLIQLVEISEDRHEITICIKADLIRCVLSHVSALVVNRGGQLVRRRTICGYFVLTILIQTVCQAGQCNHMHPPLVQTINPCIGD